MALALTVEIGMISWIQIPIHNHSGYHVLHDVISLWLVLLRVFTITPFFYCRDAGGWLSNPHAKVCHHECFSTLMQLAFQEDSSFARPPRAYHIFRVKHFQKHIFRVVDTLLESKGN